MNLPYTQHRSRKPKQEKPEPVASKVTNFVGRLKNRRKTIEAGGSAASAAPIEMTPVFMLTEESLKEEAAEAEMEPKRSKPNDHAPKSPRPPEIVVTDVEHARGSLKKNAQATAATASTVATASASAPSQRKFFPSASASASAAFSFLKGERQRAGSQSDVHSGPSSTVSSDGESVGRDREKERLRLYKKRGGSFKGPPARHPRAVRQASGGSNAWVMRPPAIVIDPPSDGESHTLFADIERIDGTH